MYRLLATSQIVVIEAGEIVMDEGETVNQFYGASGIEHRRRFLTDGIRERKAQEGPKSLAPAKHRISHRFPKLP
jgi:hypothetical protein